ncbi:MAG TPA: AAA domain-containing protein [Candidatus Sulfotelmatobacter sp.]|nr:AAA domain-containing protein [Candidatus Sulfotelmatobacter sp.]
MNETTNKLQLLTPEPSERLLKIFEFLKTYLDLRYPHVRDISQQMRVLWLNDLTPDAAIEIFRPNGDTKQEPEEEESDVVLRITRPSLTHCPTPPVAIADWLKPGWQEIDAYAEVQPTRTAREKSESEKIERFEDVPQRPAAFRKWQEERAEWQRTEQPARQALALFQGVYEWFGILEREAEQIELLVGDGLLHCPDGAGAFNHQVLLQRIELEFYPEKGDPEFVFRRREQPPELYVEFLRLLPKANHQQIAKCVDELKQAELSPLGGEETDGFLRRLIYGLFPGAGDVLAAGDPPKDDQPTIRRAPVIFMRQRRSGVENVFDMVREDIGRRSEFSSALLQIVGLGNGPRAGATEPAPLPSPKSAEREILLSKPANKEQLEIAHQLAKRDCVVVQGPPGTGKTHTIANLLGHLLAQGKRVLVTAHTPKALRVLRQKVVEPLRPLCISVLQNDKQSQEELQQSIRQISVRLTQDDQVLEREAEQIQRNREGIMAELARERTRLVEARQDEIRGIRFGGKETRPTDAAKRVKRGVGSDDWIPGPVNLGEESPLSPAEVAALYHTNARVSLRDERELKAGRPDITVLPTPKAFRELMDEITALSAQNLRYREELWNGASGPDDLAEFDRMLSRATKAIEFLKDSAPWQLEAVQAGRDGNGARQVWDSFVKMIEDSWREVQECNAQVMAHGPQVDDQRPPRELLPIVDEIIHHIEAGKSFGRLTKLTKPHCHQLITAVRIGNRPPALNQPAQFRAVRALLRMQIIREELAERWTRQMSANGGPPAEELTDQPEKVAHGFVPTIQNCMDWHQSTWLALESDFERLGFRWQDYLESTPPETGINAELRRLRAAVTGELETILKARAGWLREKHLERVWATWLAALPESNQPEAAATQEVRKALREASPKDYEQGYEELIRLKNLEPDLESRRHLLARLQTTAPAWASAVENRHPVHAKPEPPGDPADAWEWRQFHDELEQRAKTSFDELQQNIERLNKELMEATAQLAEKRTWASLIRQISPEEQHALKSYALTRNKLSKTGVGVRDAELRAAARKELTVAKGAVPVWIMPLNEVAESFDPRTTRFDVVIIDEASQCDATAMFALYLGRQAVIVGDDEQVTPIAVGVDMKEVEELIDIHLPKDFPSRQHYDGTTSIYELAQVSFGGVIRLVEHFRCAPDIIAFSNHLSYRGEIKPLREASAIKLAPHVVSHRVQWSGGVQRDEINHVEAEALASLVCAALEQPEYATNKEGKPMSFGVVSLVGDEQAMKVEAILRQRLEPAEYRRRRILCGDSAQFQGDERDVMFLSVVDAPPADPPLPIRQEGPKKIFKKRFNVAASRACDQMWVVHSLDHETDLKVGDYRRRLIEHAINPVAWEEKPNQLPNKTESVFERRVQAILTAANYVVLPRFQVGSHRVDLAVVGGGRRLAVECDGERHLEPGQLQEDMERQAVLERLGWQFVRVRGSIFLRDEERAMEPVFRRIEELGITPDAKPAEPKSPAEANELVQRVVRRAEELRSQWREENKAKEASKGPAKQGEKPVLRPRRIRTRNYSMV